MSFAYVHMTHLLWTIGSFDARQHCAQWSWLNSGRLQLFFTIFWIGFSLSFFLIGTKWLWKCPLPIVRFSTNDAWKSHSKSLIQICNKIMPHIIKNDNKKCWGIFFYADHPLTFAIYSTILIRFCHMRPRCCHEFSLSSRDSFQYSWLRGMLFSYLIFQNGKSAASSMHSFFYFFFPRYSIYAIVQH